VNSLLESIRGRYFLSAMMGTTTGAWAGTHCRGAAMAQLGVYILDAPGKHEGPAWLDSREDVLEAYLRAEFAECRRLAAPGTVVCANMFLCAEKSVESSARVFRKAGGDLYELNGHGGVAGARESGTGCYMFMPEHAEKLHRWVRMLAATGIPLTVKAKSGVIADYVPHLKRFEEAGVIAFHINVRDEQNRTQDLAALEAVRRGTRLFLMASGYVTDSASARRLFDAGADAVGVAEAAMKDPGIFGKVLAGG